MRSTLRHLVLLCALTLMTLSLATCISAEERDYVKYDAGKDEFQMLMVLRDIRVKDEDDAAYLKALYMNRDHLITPTIPGGANIISSSFSFLRMGDAQVADLNLYSSRPTDLKPFETAVPLGSIKVTPGAFFVQDKGLGFYQAITVPGKAVDAALVEIGKAAQTQDVVDSIQGEIARREGGGKVYTWEQVTAEMVKQMEIKADVPAGDAAATAATAADEAAPQKAMELDSLKALKQAVADKTLRIVREKQRFSLTLPLTARDSAGFAELYKAAVARGEEVVKTTKETPEVADKIRQSRVALQVAHAAAVSADGKGITVSFDLLEMSKAIGTMAGTRIDLNSKDKDEAAKPAPDIVEYLRAQKVPLDETLTAEQIVKDFNAGTLKGHPSEKPVAAGEGIVAAPK